MEPEYTEEPVRPSVLARVLATLLMLAFFVLAMAIVFGAGRAI